MILVGLEQTFKIFKTLQNKFLLEDSIKATDMNSINLVYVPTSRYISIEVLNVRPPVKNSIILLLSRAHIKVLKDALAHLGPYQTLIWVWYSNPGVNLKNSHKNWFCMVNPHSEQ